MRRCAKSTARPKPKPLESWSVVAVVTSNFPSEEYVFNLRTLSNIVQDQICRTPQWMPVDDHADVRHVAANIPRHDVAGQVVVRVCGYRQSRSLVLEEDHQVGHSSVIDIGIRVSHAPPARVFSEVRGHVFVNFLLQINSHGAIYADDFVGANTGARRHIAVGVLDANVVGNVTDNVVGAFDGG